MSNSIENALIAAVLMIIIAIPIYISIRNAKKRKMNKILDALHLLETQHNISLQKMAQFDSVTVAIGKIKKFMVTLRLNDFESEIFDLKEMDDCRLEERTQGKTTQLLQLILTDKKDRSLPPIIFYKQYADNEGNLKSTRVLAEEWHEMVKSVIIQTTPFVILGKAD
ncbi:hypothetical protein [Mucilaginibacter sp. L3T2-6]|uniref:hypothetical protein n=1 Tax=Mucilaginibacter sp. L3T2-6 TaxID=3062491 RepID=UPI002675928C|nr:hypothetical protein [Mucilaginibacter sp. L3T2-6]MDO3642979.1 hypothetical protein [Mucilaginibacter sp. L3T2-6]MDV6215304.1 hypothetical protein [Mucilaginibacter sp. L3T2-6]